MITVSSPCVHCEVSSAGMLGQRQAKVPYTGSAMSLAAGATVLLGENDTGRKFSCAKSSWSRRTLPSATVKPNDVPAGSKPPSLAFMPVVPPGMVTTSLDEGMSGAASL